jgi:hypothetical protein
MGTIKLMILILKDIHGENGVEPQFLRWRPPVRLG